MELKELKRPVVVDLHRIERDIALPPTEPPPARHRAALPDYITKTEGVSEIGSLSAMAVASMYEEAAKAVEAMGEEQKRVVVRCEEVIAAAHAAMEEAKTFAEACRAAGKAAYAEIENRALLVDEIRKTCGDLKQKIGLAGISVPA